ncbi:putative ferric-chelate reductase 1 [Larimichthys crocea]|uniref:putative ferric-chelate reductase 1 n=1 Tax=Larimichthys crocea TaxID=215358 RepID=UPI000F5E8BCE|nr:putative ferric-chelate reductase 1 [Larimichthys crocea]
MEGRLIVLFATLTVFVASGVQGTSHLSFSNNTEVNITRDGCGPLKLCLDNPTGCDPSTNGNCLFVSFAIKAFFLPNRADLTIDLRGNVQSPGYVAMGATLADGSTSLFVCAHNGSANATFFRTLSRNNSSNPFMPAETRVTGIRVMLKGDVIRCEFDIPGVTVNQNRITISTNPTITAGSGVVTADGGIGQFIATLNQRVNLTSAAASQWSSWKVKSLDFLFGESKDKAGPSYFQSPCTLQGPQ